MQGNVIERGGRGREDWKVDETLKPFAVPELVNLLDEQTEIKIPFDTEIEYGDSKQNLIDVREM